MKQGDGSWADDLILCFNATINCLSMNVPFIGYWMGEKNNKINSFKLFVTDRIENVLAL